MALYTPIPGQVVNPGAVVNPGGGVGPQGNPGPAVVSADTGNLLTLGTDNLASLQPAAIQPTIWSARLRSFSSVDNSNFEVDQRNVGNAVNLAAGTVSPFICDRWTVSKAAATGTVTAQRIANAAGRGFVPGTNFRISQSALSLTVGTAQASLAAGEYLYIYQSIEGPLLRELLYDVHSISLLAYSSVALNFSVALRDSANGYSLVKQVSIPANTETLITLPGLPVFTASGNFPITPGNTGYSLLITLAAGSTYSTTTQNQWISGNFLGVTGQSNFLATAGAVFNLEFVQHEPGALCTQLMDKPFGQSYDECLRYYQKTYDYGTTVGTVTGSGVMLFTNPLTAAWAVGSHRYHVPMAKIPNVTFYHHNTGVAGSIGDTAGATHTSAAVAYGNTDGIGQISFTPATAAAAALYFHYTADTGW